MATIPFGRAEIHIPPDGPVEFPKPTYCNPKIQKVWIVEGIQFDNESAAVRHATKIRLFKAFDGLGLDDLTTNVVTNYILDNRLYFGEIIAPT